MFRGLWIRWRGWRGLFILQGVFVLGVHSHRCGSAVNNKHQPRYPTGEAMDGQLKQAHPFSQRHSQSGLVSLHNPRDQYPILNSSPVHPSSRGHGGHTSYKTTSSSLLALFLILRHRLRRRFPPSKQPPYTTAPRSRTRDSRPRTEET